VLGAIAAALTLVACEAPVPAEVAPPRAAVAGRPAPTFVPPNHTFFEFQVEQPVVQAPGSRGPRYPTILRQAGVEGEVLAQFIVDTLGHAQVGTLKILRTSHDLFGAAVKEALPTMQLMRRMHLICSTPVAGGARPRREAIRRIRRIGCIRLPVS
jgi:hypothetical protein